MELIDGTSCGEWLLGLARELLGGARDAADLARGVAGLAAAAEEQVERGGAVETACRVGCPHCCVLNVAVLLPEAAAIATSLAGSLTVDELADLAGRLDRQRLRVRWMEDGERVRRQIGCPFLDTAGSCAIYPFRPLMCRGVTSLDGELCREALDPTELDVPRSVPMNMVRKAVMDEAFRVLARAAEERGMETRGIELSTGVGAFLARPELCGLLLAGERLPPELWE